jgi:CBS domain-containing protein
MKDQSLVGIITRSDILDFVLSGNATRRRTAARRRAPARRAKKKKR